MRHGYYLKRKRYAYSGTKELTVKKLGSKENRKRKTCMKTERKKHQGPGWPDDPDGGPDDPDRARTIRTPIRTIRTPIRTIRLIRPKTTEASPLKPDHPDPARTSGPPAGHADLHRHCLRHQLIRASTRIIRLHPRIIRPATAPACWAEPVYPFAP